MPPSKRRCFIHPKQLSPFPERLDLPYPSSQDRFTTWVKADPKLPNSDMWLTFKRPSQNIARQPCEGKNHPLENISSIRANPLIRSKRRSIYNWNPGPRRGKEGTIEKQTAGKWHIITLQEAIEHVDHELLTNRFHVTHYGGRAVLFNKDTFCPDVKVKSMYLHDTRRDLPGKVMEGDQGQVLQGMLSRASFRRPPLSGQKTFTVLSLHISNIYAKKTWYCEKTHPYDSRCAA